MIVAVVYHGLYFEINIRESPLNNINFATHAKRNLLRNEYYSLLFTAILNIFMVV